MYVVYVAYLYKYVREATVHKGAHCMQCAVHMHISLRVSLFASFSQNTVLLPIGVWEVPKTHLGTS